MKQTLNEEIKRIHQMMGIENKLIIEGDIIDDIILLVSRNVDDIRVSDNQLANVLQRLKSTSPSQLTTAERRILVGAIQNNLAFDKYTLQVVFDSWQTQFTEAKNVNDVVAIMLNSTDSQGKKFIENIQSGSLQFNDFLNSYFGDAAPAVRRSVANAMPGKNFTDPMNLKKWSDNLLAKMSDSLDFDAEDIVSRGNDSMNDLKNYLKQKNIKTPTELPTGIDFWLGWFLKRVAGIPQLNGTAVGRAMMNPEVRALFANKSKKDFLQKVQDEYSKFRLKKENPSNEALPASELAKFFEDPGFYPWFTSLSFQRQIGFLIFCGLGGISFTGAVLILGGDLLGWGREGVEAAREGLALQRTAWSGGVTKLDQENEEKIMLAIVELQPKYQDSETGSFDINKYYLEYSKDGKKVSVFQNEEPYDMLGEYTLEQINEKLSSKSE
jgi:hypothetical protein